jgi:phosphopentomutase
MEATQSGRFIIVVLDGFGVGEMPDVAEVRPQDAGSHTCRHIFARRPDLHLPTLEKLGLVNITGPLSPKMQASPGAISGKAMLMHFGADTFFGHQEIMGTLPRKPFAEPFCKRIAAARALLLEHGFQVRDLPAGNSSLLIVEESVTVGDNVEADPGQAINITAALDDIPFERVLEIGKLVRTVSQVPRVIAFGGRGVHLPNLLAALELHGEAVGVNAPASGVYNEDYHCIHMGYGVDPEVQVPTILGRAGYPVFLLGKVADVVSNQFGVSIPMVDTGEVLAETLDLVRSHANAFFCVNVQETDLCGHRENIDEYAAKLQAADAGIASLMKAMAPPDILVVMADHGNDPSVGHPHHTREMVPLMIHAPVLQLQAPLDLGICRTLSDVGASAAAYFGVQAPENGRSFLREIAG